MTSGLAEASWTRVPACHSPQKTELMSVAYDAARRVIPSPRARRTTRIAALAAALAILVLISVWFVIRAPQAPGDPALVVNDVTQLNPIGVAEIVVPTTTEEIIAAVRRHGGAISIGGARHTMGGQIAAAGGLHIDMRSFNRILSYSAAEKLITVQAGATWRDILKRIDRDDLSVSIMQSYADFTVGGSLSVNVHGRYAGSGPLIASVSSFTIVLADGSLVGASPTTNPEIFYGAIGGYGGLGVITDVTLRLTENIRLAHGSRDADCRVPRGLHATDPQFT